MFCGDPWSCSETICQVTDIVDKVFIDVLMLGARKTRKRGLTSKDVHVKTGVLSYTGYGEEKY